MRKIFQYGLIFCLMITTGIVHSQTVYYSVAHTALYDFLDEMATDGIIAVNAAVKPWSRTFIAEKLAEIRSSDSLLNKRQKQELNFYLKDFFKELAKADDSIKKFQPFYFLYKDSTFTFSVKPVAGSYFFSNNNGFMYQRWVGAEAFAYVGSHWGFYAGLRDYKEDKPFSSPMYLDERGGFKYKNKTDFSDMKGGITYAWKWGTIGFIKDQFIWGTNYNGSNIFSGRTPSFAQIRMKLTPIKWFEFNYVHAWIISEVNDSSSRVYNGNVFLNRPKYLTANMFTFRPVRDLALSFGNSIIYYDYDYPGYIIPVFFYKSVAHTNSANGEAVNAQLFFDASVRLFKHFHLYSTLFVDEISMSNAFDKSKSTNYLSYKGGCAIENLPVKNVKFIFEYTRTNPLVYQHNVAMTTFESNGYNMGHYLRDNAEEFYTSVIVKPYSTLRLQGKFLYARKGREYAGDRTGIYAGQPFIPTTDWKNRMLALAASYQIVDDLYVSAEMQNSIYSGNPVYTAPYFWGHQLTWILGLIYGF
jgi:hypothetical protein